ncbi:MAG: porin [Rhodospirillales bacterium]
MKAKLLATTAFVAAGLVLFDQAAQAQSKAPSVSVRGYYDVEAGFSDQKDGRPLVGRRVTFDTIQDVEVHFNISAALDNGLRFDGRVELEGGSEGDQIDESWLRARWFFGDIYLGSRNPEAYKNTYFAPDVGTETVDYERWIIVKSGASTSGESPFLDPRLRFGCNDCDNVTYVTPRFAGFQLTGSYLPNVEQDLNTSIATTDSVYNKGVALGLNFDRKFDQLQIGFNAHYQTWLGVPAGLPDDPWGLTISGKISYAGFTVGGAWMLVEDFRSGATNSQDGSGWEVGASYAFGPNAVSFVYRKGEDEDSTTVSGSDEIDVYAVGFNRDLGPGVRLYANVIYFDLTGENPGTADDNKGWIAFTGLGLRF